ncbi:MAG TPA: peptidoglycan DD-metalloendopeptidase family protein [Anaerolineaceae bacterium]|nr:peptidoglycan DD-metalloendopeptidase family protein [Anaerolineaceae bacterium]
MLNKFLSIFLIVLLILLSNPVVVEAQNSVDYPDYVIRQGDSLGYIASLFDTTINEIIELNNISNPDFISPGQIIKIPSLPGTTGTLELVTTQLGENYSILSVKYSADVAEITRINRVLAPTRIFPGSTLIIPTQKSVGSLIPVDNIIQNETGLECAVGNGKNPHVLNLQNQINNVNLEIPGMIIFSDSTRGSKLIDLFAPLIDEVKLYPLPLVQGATEVVSVKSDSPLILKGTLGEYELTFFNDTASQYYSLQGIHALADPGLVEFKLSATFEDGSTHSFSQMVLLSPGIFEEDPPLSVDPKTIEPSVTEPENELVFSLISSISPNKYWVDIFSSPAVYQEYNSLFGTRRWYNDDPEVRFHSGVDFAGGLTLPVSSPAPGLVVFAGPLTVRGNTVFIDHGWGVFSGFFHQDTLYVKVGDRVETGQAIGTVGNTGRVNGAGDYYGAGAHLHWELWVNKVQVDPLNWLTEKYP